MFLNFLLVPVEMKGREGEKLKLVIIYKNLAKIQSLEETLPIITNYHVQSAWLLDHSKLPFSWDPNTLYFYA